MPNNDEVRTRVEQRYAGPWTTNLTWHIDRFLTLFDDPQFHFVGTQIAGGDVPVDLDVVVVTSGRLFELNYLASQDHVTISGGTLREITQIGMEIQSSTVDLHAFSAGARVWGWKTDDSVQSRELRELGEHLLRRVG